MIVRVFRYLYKTYDCPTAVSAIDSEKGLLCQSRDAQGWHGTRSNKGLTGKGSCYLVCMYMYVCG